MALRRFGARTLGEVRRLLFAALARRIGEESRQLLERAYGERPDPHPGFVFPECFTLPLQLPSAVDNAAALLFAVHQAGMREVVLHLRYRRDETRVALRFTGPTADGGRIERIWRSLRPSRRSAWKRCASKCCSATTARCRTTRRPARKRSASCWNARVARLGEERVCRIASRADYRPERAARRVRPLGKYTSSCAPPLPQLRPLWLLAGPERIESGW
jgi:protein ImuB